MAPFVGPSREVVLRELRGRPRLPITLGKYKPEAMIAREGEEWVLRPLVLDEAAYQAAYEKARAGDGYWMPEHEFQFLRPGEAIVQASTREAFVAALEKIEWGWS